MSASDKDYSKTAYVRDVSKIALESTDRQGIRQMGALLSIQKNPIMQGFWPGTWDMSGV